MKRRHFVHDEEAGKMRELVPASVAEVITLPSGRKAEILTASMSNHAPITGLEHRQINDLASKINRNLQETKALRERVDYLNVAVMRGDPRYAREEFADPSFDTAEFDSQWSSRGKRVPPIEEIFG